MPVETRRRIKWQVLHEIIRTLTAPESEDEDLEHILKVSVETTAADSGSLFMAHSTVDHLQLVAAVGLPEGIADMAHELRQSIDEGRTGSCFRTLHPYIMKDLTVPGHYSQIAAIVRSEVGVPVIAPSRPLGVLVLNSRRVSNFSHQDIEFLTVIASFIGAYLEKHVAPALRPQSPKELARDNIRFAFVLMPFRDPFNKYYRSIIKPAIEEAGLLPFRADEIYRPSEIISDIYEFIDGAEVIVAELTGRNPNVLYELGYSRAVGKTAIMITQTVADIPFDLRGHRCITYDTTDPDWAPDLRETIVKFIMGVEPTALGK